MSAALKKIDQILLYMNENTNNKKQLSEEEQLRKFFDLTKSGLERKFTRKFGDNQDKIELAGMTLSVMNANRDKKESIEILMNAFLAGEPLSLSLSKKEACDKVGCKLLTKNHFTSVLDEALTYSCKEGHSLAIRNSRNEIVAVALSIEDQKGRKAKLEAFQKPKQDDPWIHVLNICNSLSPDDYFKNPNMKKDIYKLVHIGFVATRKDYEGLGLASSLTAATIKLAQLRNMDGVWTEATSGSRFVFSKQNFQRVTHTYYDEYNGNIKDGKDHRCFISKYRNISVDRPSVDAAWGMFRPI